MSLRVSDLDPGLSYAVFLQNTPVLWDVVPRADALGWYALPRWGKGNDGVSDPAFDRCGLGAKCGNRGRRPRLQRRLGRCCCLSGQLIAVEAGAAPHVGWAAFGGPTPCAIDGFIEEDEGLFAASE